MFREYTISNVPCVEEPILRYLIFHFSFWTGLTFLMRSRKGISGCNPIMINAFLGSG